MTISRLLPGSPNALPEVRIPSSPPRRFGHDHFWERASTRGVFVKRAAAAAGAAVTSGLWFPSVAGAGDDDDNGTAAPRPIPANPALFGLHVQLPGEGNEPSSIFDFKGFVGIAEIVGAGTARNRDGSRRRLFFSVDNRFMTGAFVGLDGRLHHGTFAFT